MCITTVTLFVLMIGNNWHVIMVSSFRASSGFIYPYLHVQEGFASESRLGWLVRLYFLSFNIITLVIFGVAIAFLVDAFVYKVLARQRHRICHKHLKALKHCQCEGKLLHVHVHVIIVLNDCIL